MLELYWKGVNITDGVNIRTADHKDTHGRYDSLDMTLERWENWLKWGPEVDDELELRLDEYSTGKLYLNAMAPKDGRFRVLASAARSGSRIPRSESFEGRSLGEIGKATAERAGMQWRCYGIDEEIRYPYILRNNMTAAAFLSYLAGLEGAVLKIWGGCFLMIGLKEAERQKAVETIPLKIPQPGVAYKRRWDLGRSAVTVVTPWGNGRAMDPEEAEGIPLVLCGTPASDLADAARFAGNRLEMDNRNRETLILESTFRPKWSACVRIDTEGPEELGGKWILDGVDHDLKNGRSIGRLSRIGKWK